MSSIDSFCCFSAFAIRVCLSSALCGYLHLYDICIDSFVGGFYIHNAYLTAAQFGQLVRV